MKKSWLKVFSAVLAILILCTALIGCSSGSKEADKKGSDTSETGAGDTASNTAAGPMKANLKFVFPGDPPKGQDGVVAAVEEKLKQDGLDFKLEFTFVPWGEYWNKLALLAAGGEEYDLTWTHVSTLSDLVSKQALMPLDEALKKTGQDLLKNVPDYVWKGATINNEIYAIPRTVPLADSEEFLAIRGDLRKKYGVPEVKTLADLEKYFEEVHKNNPDMYVMYNDHSRFLYREYGNVYFPIGNFGKYPVYIDPADSELKVKNYYESDIFKNIIRKRNEWYKKGYMPKEIDEIADAEAAFNTGKLASIWSVVLKTSERIDGFKTAMPEGEIEDVFLNPEKPKYIWTTVDNMLSVFSTSTQVEQSVAFVDWMRKSQENFDLFSYGVKDVNYKLENESVSYEGIEDTNSYVPINWAWNDLMFSRYSKHLSKEYVDKLKNWDKDAVPSPLIGFTLNQEPIKMQIAQVNAVEGEYITEADYGSLELDAFYDDFIKKLKDSGIDEIIAEVQKQVNEFKAANK